jgi:membrane protein DedA with SNARE-associated domain
VPLVAGIFDMPRLRFQLANVASALIWAVGILAPGAGLLEWWRG